MKIAILVGGLPPIYNGGTEIATVKIAEYAAKAGHEIHIIAADANHGENEYRKLENGFKVHRVQTLPPRYIHALTYIPSAVKKLLDIKPDLIHAQAIYMTPSAYVVNKMVGIPYLVYERGGVYLKYFMSGKVRKLFFNDATRVIAQTENQKSEIIKYANRKVEVIPNGIDVERFRHLDKHEAREKLGLPQDKKIVISVGRCRPEKNLRQFVYAAKAYNGDNALFVLVGEGQQLSELKQLACGKVMFTGGVNNSDVPDWLCAADILVNTSTSEGFPVALLEAMASGLPVVVPNICGIPEIINNGVNGFLSIPNDYWSTVNLVDRILSDSQLSRCMAKNNIGKAKEFTWENVIRKLYR
jgi:glycosyltransferase involved in cell wall biosynthesis